MVALFPNTPNKKKDSLGTESLNPNNFTLFDILIPFATAKATRIVEKLPGPLFTRTVKSSSIFALCLLIKFNMVKANISLFLILV